MRCRNYFVWLVSLFLGLCMLSACHEKEEPVKIEEEADSNHTLLIYMIGDNDLSGYCRQNTNNSIIGLLDSPHPLNLVIYEDSKTSGENKNGKPVLFRLKRNAENKQKVDTTFIKMYEEDWNSTDSEVMQQVLNDVFSEYDTEVKGLELWSHASGWVPSGATSVSPARPMGDFEPETRSTESVGLDSNVCHMELWTLRETLEKCPHLDYIFYDACNMGQAEVAYELRNVADYMMACPTEIMAAGLPYQTIIRSLSTCDSKASLLNALKMTVDDFAVLYDGSSSHEGTYALTDLRQMENLRAAYLGLRETYAERVQLLDEHCYTYEDNITHYGRSYVGTRYCFYDLLDAARFFAGADTLGASFTHLKEVLGKTVVKEYHTSSFLDIYNIRGCSFGVALPEMFQAANNTNTLRAGYAKLQWAQ